MALRADLDAQLFLRRAGGENFTAGAVNGSLLVVGMDLCFHEFNLGAVGA
jgi:hypothetical protein